MIKGLIILNDSIMIVGGIGVEDSNILDLSNLFSSSFLMSPMSHTLGRKNIINEIAVVESNEEVEVVKKYFLNSAYYGKKWTLQSLKKFLKDHGVPGRVGNKRELSLKAYEIIKNLKDDENTVDTDRKGII
jgi:hypothetical protein